MTVIIFDDSGLPATIYSYLLFEFSYLIIYDASGLYPWSSKHYQITFFEKQEKTLLAPSTFDHEWNVFPNKKVKVVGTLDILVVAT